MSDKEEMVQVGENFYPKWAVEKAKRLLVKAGHIDLERMIQSVIVVHDSLKNAVPADPNEPGVAFTPGEIIIRISMINR